MSTEKALKLLKAIETANRMHNRYLAVKYRAIDHREKMRPIVENIKEGMTIGHGVGKVLNDEVTRNDVKWAFNTIKKRTLNGIERAAYAKKKASQKKRSRKSKAYSKKA